MNKNKRIETLKYYGIVGMCLLHSSYLLEGINIKLPLYNIVSYGGGIALPLYFFLSAFFFVYNFSLDRIETKIISRIKSVILPYFFWNLFFIEAYAFFHWLQNHTGFILTRETYFPGGSKEILRFVWLGYRDPPLWYLQILMEFILVTPVLFILFRKYKKISFLMIVVFLIINLWFYGDIKYASVVYWMPVYGGGYGLAFIAQKMF